MKTHGTNQAFGFGYSSEGQWTEYLGLTKREYFAAMAMQGTMSSDINGDWPDCKSQAEYSVKCADALIEALNIEVLNGENQTDEQSNSI